MIPLVRLITAVTVTEFLVGLAGLTRSFSHLIDVWSLSHATVRGVCPVRVWNSAQQKNAFVHDCYRSSFRAGESLSGFVIGDAMSCSWPGGAILGQGSLEFVQGLWQSLKCLIGLD